MHSLSHQTLRNSLKKVTSPRILVLGDLMLDRYSWGSVSRVSPEAPVPVLCVKREDQRLGGAGNVMVNLQTLGAEVIACAYVGSDDAGKVVLDLLREQGIDASGVQESQCSTVLKHRMISGQHHLLRLDSEPARESFPECDSRLIKFIEETLPHVDAVVVSDYGKGVVTSDLISALVSKKKSEEGSACPILVDPCRHADYSMYEHCTLIKPNRPEAEAAVGFALQDQKSILKAAEYLKSKLSLEHVVLSLDREGLLLYTSAEQYSFMEAEAREVFDVVGAGDMVVSVLAFMLAGRASLKQAGFWAQLAAGLEVQHVGVVSFTKAELLQRFEFGDTSGKITSLDQLCQELASQNLSPSMRPLVFTNGYFDEISAGHLKFLHQLKAFKGFNIVAINSDHAIIRQKGLPPLLNEQERALLLSAIEAVDRVIIFDTDHAGDLILKLEPDLVVKGERYRNQAILEQPMIEQVHASIEYLLEY